MTEKVGEIYYDVTLETQDLLNKSKEVDKTLGKTATSVQLQMTKTASAVQEMARQAQAAQGPLSGLTKLLAGLLTIQGANGLIQMAESYNEMGERVKMATRSTEEYEQVQQRLLATANGTYRALSEAQEVFIGTSDNIRDMGYTLDEALDITDSLSYAFVRNATSSERASNALRAYDMALNKGKVEADGWLTIVGAIPTIANAIAEATGKSAQQIREMGASGGMAAELLNRGLLASLKSNKDAADGMNVTLKDAFTTLKNNLQAYIGEANQSTGVTKALSSAVQLLGGNIKTVVNVLVTLGAGALAKYVAQTLASVAASAQATLAARTQAAAELQKAQAHVAATAAAVAQAEAGVALGASTALATEAAAAHTAALATEAAAQRAAAAAGVGLIGILGGPAGIIALVASAAAGIYLFGQNSANAAPKVDQLTDSIEKLNKEQIAGRKVMAGHAVDELTLKLRAADATVKSLEKDYTAMQRNVGRGVDAKGLQNVADQISLAKKEAADAAQELQAMVNAQQKLSAAELAYDESKRGGGRSRTPAADPEVVKRLNGMRDELELAKLTGVARARLQAIQKLGANATAEERAEAEKLATSIYNLEQAHKVAGQAATGSASERKKAAESDAKALDQMAESLRRVGLSAEDLAVVQAKSGLSKFATPEDVARIGEMAQKLFELQQQAKADENIAGLRQQLELATLAGKELAETKAVLELGTYATDKQKADARELAANIYDAVEQARALQAMGNNPGQFIKGDVKPLSGGAFDDQTARYQAEAEQEAERYQGQMDRLQQALDAKAITLQGAFDLEQQMYQQHSDRLQQIESARYQTQLGQASNAFSQVASATKQFSGEQSALYKVMFAASKAFSIAQSIVAIQTGIAQAAALPFPANLPAMASVAAATAGIVSTISGTDIAGARQYGGPTEAGKVYRVNETGAPEVWTGSNGNQYMLGSKAGNVTPVNEVGGGSRPMVVNIHNAPPGTYATQTPDGNQLDFYINKAEQRVAAGIKNNDGPVWSALRASTNVQSRL